MDYITVLDKNGNGIIDMYEPIPTTVYGEPFNMLNYKNNVNILIRDLDFLYDTKSDMEIYTEIATTDNALARLDYMNYQLTGIKTFCGLFSLSMFGVLAITLCRRLLGGAV